MAVKRGSYRPATLPTSTTPDRTPEQIAQDAETIARLQASGLSFSEAFRGLLIERIDA